jgi:hypothetical protein
MGSMLKRPEQLNMDKRFGALDEKSLYRAGSLVTVSKQLSKYKLQLVGSQDVSGTEPAGESGRRRRTMNLVQVYCA